MQLSQADVTGAARRFDGSSSRPEQADRFIAFEEIEQKLQRLAARGGEARVLGQYETRVVAGGSQQLRKVGHGGQAELGHPALARAEQFAAAAQLQVLLGDLETVLGGLQQFQALARSIPEWGPMKQHAVALTATAAHSAAQLVQLGEPKALRVL